MKITYGKILVLAMAAAILLLTAVLPCGAVEKKEENIWSDDEPKYGSRQWEPTEEAIERIMKRLAEAEPAKARELQRLRRRDPEKFKAELRKVMREQFSRRLGEQRGRRAGQEPRPVPGRPSTGRGGRVAPAIASRERTPRGYLQERDAGFLEWLKKDYPEEAEKIAKLKEKKPEFHRRQLALTYRQYRRIFEASKENPKLAKVLKEDLELTKRRDMLLRKIRAASNKDEKKKLVKELKDAVSSRFDLIIRRRQIKYERLREELEKLREQVKQSEAEVEKWKAAKSEKVKERLEELISKTEKFRWD